MARLELYPLSIAEFNGNPRNLVSYLLAGEFRSEAPVTVRREQIAACILQGGYPEILGKSTRTRSLWFTSCLEGRLFKDFENLHAARGDYHTKLKSMVPYLAGLCGNLLQYANVANDLELHNELTKTYIEVLELMFIIQRLPAWLKNTAKREATRMPKLHFVDTGLACHLLKLRSAEQLLASQYYGGLFENLVYLECAKQLGWADEQCQLYHFRDRRKNEVDIVLEREDGSIIGIECKASASVNAGDFKGLTAGNTPPYPWGCFFKEDQHAVRCTSTYVVVLGVISRIFRSSHNAPFRTHRRGICLRNTAALSASSHRAIGNNVHWPH